MHGTAAPDAWERGHRAHTTLRHISIPGEFPGKMNAKSVIKVYLHV